MAFRRLEQKLTSLAEEERARQKAAAHKAKPPASFGSWKRTYRLIGPKGVFDSSTGYGESNPQTVLNGRIDGFLRASLLSRSEPLPGSRSSTK